VSLAMLLIREHSLAVASGFQMSGNGMLVVRECAFNT